MTESDNRFDLLIHLEKHAERVDDVKPFCVDEAKTETYLVEPLLGVLGYDCSDPREVDKRYVADVPGRKGEKVDYALKREGHPVVLVEAKVAGNSLGPGEIGQLQRYFPHTPARLAVLTDGVQWHWFKSMSDPVRSHEMETSPFLIYDAREPSESAVEWLTHITKDGFDVLALLRVSRRIEFTCMVRKWIARSLVNPSAAGADQIRDVAGLDASDDELPLVVESIQAAWMQELEDHAGQVGGFTAAEDSNNPTGASAEMPDPDSSDANDAWHSSPDSSDDELQLQSESHWDERFDLGDGRVLDANRLPRAWRVGDEAWVEEKNGTLTVTAVLTELLRCDKDRHDESGLAERLGLHYSISQPSNRKLRLIPGFSNIYWQMNMNNFFKAKLLEEVASKVQFDPPQDSPLVNVPRVEWWLPDKPKR